MLTINYFPEVWIFLLLILKLCNIAEAENGICTSPESKKVCCTNYHEVNDVCMKCPIGTYGENCTENCPDGKYGEFCLQQCECKMNQQCNFMFGCLEQDLEPQFKFTTFTLLKISAGFLIITSIVIGVTVCVVKRNNLSRNYSVYQSPVPVFYSADKQIQLSEIEQEHYQTLF
ncbi:N-acetylglucosamine-1-phosphodiester alpha-N-acetylglucosaminidase-like isoform X2 [Magallana gigas]|uniref:N-acetylglucosamine-1-phosphodiester alpha-N-acetylglucosaminidase-like isoform X2 n=1 Tax=Magallana gigas TaxID=29159 RepID=UPI00333F62F2